MPYTTELIALIGSVIGLLYAVALIRNVLSHSPGTQEMKQLADYIKEGANAFLKREYLTITPIAVVIALVIGLTVHPLGIVALGFVIGGALSAVAGYVSISTTVRSSSRTAEAAKKGLGEALTVAFRGGSVLGMLVPSLALLGLALFYMAFPSTAAIVGFGFGASLVAMFIRVGGGIYTKAADLGADIVGKIEEGIPEDDPRNPGVIADNVGDNVGDCAGMGADVYESYIVTALAAMLLGALVFSSNSPLVAYPLAIGGLGVIASIIGGLWIRKSVKGEPMSALNTALYIAAVVAIILDAIFTLKLFSGVLSYALIGSIILGVLVVVLIERVTDYFTSYTYNPVKRIAESSQTGPATNFLTGFATGLSSTAPVALILVAAIIVSYLGGYYASGGKPLFGVYSTAITTMSMLSLTGIILSIDAFGPITDNANGIVEMAHVEGVREVTDKLDAMGNTTKATTKGFAIGSAALAALSLFIAFQREVSAIYLAHGDPQPPLFALYDPYVLVGLLIGGLLPFYYSSFLIGAVGRAGFRMVNEIRRQFREIPGLREGKAKPDYQKCVDISTQAALKELIAPGLLAILTPIVVGVLLGPVALGGLLIGSVVSGVFLALLMANAGAAWDNAKKYIEAGNFGGKGTPTHAAAVSGDTVGDPFKDTAGPSINSLIKVLNTISIVFVALFVLLHL
ncbi:sodium-translocating pyrophosphatase [Candidatus Marsarchaeota G1 archaeon OSP_D]|jgi:vacuolar-type H(+)-translocating pyrophosphatase|uniref:K(+)-insensitive pyrophosphate-energized proton pump n=4 Tax=Candidatus Marsarchaeota TaxID=1978152 RepID=A0A2R6C0F1_9ARCH|nr:MAG: sodium-translocating pyrophosphatase [Candidatus Marsarchaeota G1 archaeon OSP_D]PSN89485.1 MAG: sodium-translocating pyrophosphatase [Candidatus Marsarchaeota G1 archaeon OSP_C]PSO04365.1 MAG: sodium-translocating pyrophosphatase [Candidatus Marsarchaeota G2 archaeon ECH_B_SAG-G06]